MISVVIPYFQREPGVLRRALASVARQHECGLPVEVIVVDDASPVPAADEVDRDWPTGTTVRVIARPNGGPGAARNAGLDSVSPATHYIAFLDSDDEWSDDHLARAVQALDQGFDFYFADLFQLDQTVGAFARGGRIDPAEHPLLSTAQPRLHAYQSDLFDQVLRGNVIGTPTVVYRRAGLADVRFRTEFTTAGEDYLFWLEIARRGARVAFSSQVETTCGKGVNVFASAGWGTDAHLLRLHQEIRYRLAIRSQFELNGLQRAHIARDLQRLRMGFVRDLLHRLRHRKHMPANLLVAHAKADPRSLIDWPLNVLRIAGGR